MAPVTLNDNTKLESTEPNETLPDWLNKDFFVEIIEKEFGECEIVDMTIKKASQTGENYTSIMHRVSIDVKLPDKTIETVKYITKSTIAGEKTDQLVDGLSAFPKEIEMYEKIVPQIEEIYQKAGYEISIGAKCVKTQQDPPIIVLEDLGARRYANIKRQNGMDLHHAEITLEKLAKWHAATACIHKLHGDYSLHFNQSTIPPYLEEVFEPMFNAMWPAVRDGITSWGCEKYLEKIERTHKRFFHLVHDCEKIDPLEFNVLNHGDMWSNNIMFRHNDDGSVADVKFVDLQIGRWGTPVQDLLYFIVSSCNLDIRLAKFDYLIKHYHDHLVKNLEILQYSGKIPKLIDLQAQIIKRGFFAFQTAFSVLPIVLLDPNENATVENFMGENDAGMNFRKSLYENRRYGETMRQLLPFLECRGVLDL